MRFAISSSVLLLVVACGEVKEGPGVGSFTLTATLDDVFVRQTRSIDVEVSVGRTNLEDDIVITLATPPTGVTAQPVTLADGATTGLVKIEAGDNAAQGDITVELVGTAGTVTASDTISVLVGGDPGTLDLTFGDGGKVLPMIPGAGMVGRGATIDDQGRTLVTGFVTSSPNQSFVVRLTPDGALDTAFGGSGIVSTGSGVIARGNAVKTTADAVFVAGIAGGATVNDNNFGLFRYTTAGVLDDNFGDGGVVSFDPGVTNITSELRTLDIAPDGALLVGGHTYPMGGGVLSYVLRYSQLGVRDNTYNLATDGNIYSSAVQPDGKFVFAGMRDVEFLVGRLQASGVRDNGFGMSQGELVTGFSPANADAYGLAVLPDGKVLAVGIASATATDTICLARYNTNGSIDVTFGTAGKIITSIPFGSFAYNALVVTGDKLLFVGQRGQTPAVARMNLDGTPDTTFGTNGVATVDFGIGGGSFTAGGYGVAVAADGRIVISAELGDAPNQRLGIARFWP